MSTKGANYIKHGIRVRRIDNFYQESEVHHFKVHSDEHLEPWGGGGKGPSPLEYVLSAMGFSINNQILIQSEVNGVRLDSLETVVTASFDAKGCLDIKGHNPRLSEVSLEFNIASDSPMESLQKVLEKATHCDPLYQTFRGVAKMQRKLHLVGERRSKHFSDRKGGEKK